MHSYEKQGEGGIAFLFQSPTSDLQPPTSNLTRLVAALLCGLLVSLTAHAADSNPAKLELKSGWAMQSSAEVSVTGEVISRPGFRAASWYALSAPGTVLAGLVENKVYPDPYFGKNLRSIPGTTYPIGGEFSNLPMPESSPFRPAWWFRNEFALPASLKGKRVWLHLDGINYRANVWLNGQRIADLRQIVGAFRIFTLDLSAAAKPGETNALAIEVFPPQPDDLGITFVDWNPGPPDKNMGLWRDVWIGTSGPVAIESPQVITRLDLPRLDVAHLTVTAELRNSSSGPISGKLRGGIENVVFVQNVALQPHETKLVKFAPAEYAQLNLSHPRIWWPYRFGQPEMYQLTLDFEAGGEISDRQALKFGINQITAEKTPEGYLLFRVNGRKVLIRGAAWTPDMLQRRSAARLAADFRYVKDMNLNAVRLEGKLDNDGFFEMADQMGILVMPGWSCCDQWEKWKKWNPENREVAAASLTDQIKRLRNHPSVFVWLNGSDNPPPADIEKMYLDIEAKLNWPKPILSSAEHLKAELTGDPGVKMTGPYDYVPPGYWLQDTKNGGAYGFSTETSQGPAIPQIESLKKFLPADKLWPPNDYWDYHAGGGMFKNIGKFSAALDGRYGKARGLEDFVWKAQAMAYEGERAMFEAYGRNKYTATGVIHWMLNNAWPSLIWNLYDYYQRPNAGYFATKKACESLHIQYSYDDHSIAVVNEYSRALEGLKVKAEVFNFDLTQKLSKQVSILIPADTSLRAFALPEISGLSSTYFLRLTLLDADGRVVSKNFYWLSTKQDELDWRGTNWYYTRQSSFADLSPLAGLPPATVQVSSDFSSKGAEGVARVRVANTGSSLAFLVRLKVTRGKGGEEVLPILWEDNYFELFPGESREVTATYRLSDLGEATPIVEVDGWNVARKPN
jgi:exo-1,4-beta-D-glucosaminidase